MFLRIVVLPTVGLTLAALSYLRSNKLTYGSNDMSSAKLCLSEVSVGGVAGNALAFVCARLGKVFLKSESKAEEGLWQLRLCILSVGSRIQSVHVHVPGYRHLPVSHSVCTASDRGSPCRIGRTALGLEHCYDDGKVFTIEGSPGPCALEQEYRMAEKWFVEVKELIEEQQRGVTFKF